MHSTFYNQYLPNLLNIFTPNIRIGRKSVISQIPCRIVIGNRSGTRMSQGHYHRQNTDAKQEHKHCHYGDFNLSSGYFFFWQLAGPSRTVQAFGTEV